MKKYFIKLFEDVVFKFISPYFDLLNKKFTKSFLKIEDSLSLNNRLLLKNQNAILNAILKLEKMESKINLKFETFERLGKDPNSVKSPGFDQYLSDFFEIADLRIFDIGGRGGPLSFFKQFSKFCNLILCDADKTAAEEMQKDEVLQGSWKSVKILPHAIGNPLRKTLYLTNQPGLSSQLPPNGEVFKTYLNSNEWHVREEVVVNVKSLDDSLTEEVDFLKIDTQGTELEILKSGLSRVLPNCLMIYCEITYIKLYQDMYSYPEFLLFMEENGFEILDIKRTSSKRLNEDNLYSKREFSWSHTLFIKKDFSGLNEIKLKKLICLLVSLEYFDYASYLARNFLKQESFKELLESIKNYSKAFNIVLQKSMNSWEYSKVSRNQLKDRDFER